MLLKITISKEVLECAKMCGTDDTGHNCAVALAVRDIFPLAWVRRTEINPFGIYEGYRIKLPQDATDFIDEFDWLRNKPEQRPLLPPFSFTVELPDEVVERIDISDIEKSLTLELVG